MQTPSLKHMSFKQALGYARTLSGMTKEEVAEASGLPPANVAQYFQENDTSYSPSPAHIPLLCRVLGNRVLVDWIIAHTEAHFPAPVINSVDALIHAVLGTTSNNGELSRLTRDVAEDGMVDSGETKALIGRVDENITYLKGLKSGLEASLGQGYRGGKRNNMEVRQ